MKTILKSILLLLLLTPSFGAASSPPTPLLKDNGLWAGPPAKVLPQNAIVHIQVNQPQRILENFERLALSTVPEALLPAPLQSLFGTEHPILTMLGMQSIQVPLTTEQIAEKIGLATDQPASFTLYPGLPTQSFILSLPIKNHATFEQFCRDALHPKTMEAATLGGKPFVRLELHQSPVRELFVACSSDRVFVSGDQSLLLLLYRDNSFPRLDKNPHFAGVTERAAQEDIWITFDPALVKPILSQLEFFEYLPLKLVSQKRAELLKMVPTQQREVIEQRLRLQLGIQSLDEFADYAECVLGATYEELFEFIMTCVKSFNGVTLTAKLDAAFPQFTVNLHSDQFRSDAGTQPIPLDAVRTALGRLPGQHNHLTVSGRQPKIEPSVHFTSWLKRVRAGFEAKHLNLAFVEALEKLHHDTIRPQPVATQAPWTMKTRAAVNPISSPADHDSLQAYFRDAATLFSYPAMREITIAPSVGNDLLQTSLASQRDALIQNRELVHKTFSSSGDLEPFIDTVYRLNQRELKAGVKELTWETSLISRGGFFGFNQHELVSRRIYYSRTLGEYSVFHQASKDAQWISDLQLQRDPKRAGGLEKLLDHVPEGANYVCIHRPLADLPALLGWVQGFEDLLHRDADAYLAKARRIGEGMTNQTELVQKLETLKFSPTVLSINRDAVSGEIYCLLPGNLAFPRPKVTPAVLKLFAEFNRSADEVGGMLFYTRVSDGKIEASFIQSTEAISKLIKSVGNAIHKQYLSDPQNLAELLSLVVTDRDKDAKRLNEILIRNPSWDFLPRAGAQSGPKNSKAKSEARPHHPIAPRDSQTSANLIDLTPHYNASPNDSWHEGGIGNNDLKSLPQGNRDFAGVKFDVRGIVQLSGQGADEQLTVRFPKEIKSIAVDRPCSQLHFLQGAGWSSPDGTKIGSYIVHYQDGKTAEIPIVYGMHVRDWWTPPGEHPVSGSEIAWKGSNEAATASQMRQQLYKTTWKNPRPETPIASLDYVSAMAISAPFLIALTAE